MKKDNIGIALAELKALDQRDVMQESMLNTLSHMAQMKLHGFADIDGLAVEFNYSGGLARIQIEMKFDKERESFMMYGKFPLNCREEKRAFMNELICRINYGTVLGCFEFDPRDGECKLKYTHYIGDTAMSEAQAERAIGITISSMHRYADTLIPLFLGLEPDTKKSCMEYDMMKNDDEPASLLDALRKIRKTRDAVKEGAPESKEISIEQEFGAFLDDDSADFDALLEEAGAISGSNEPQTGFFSE